MASSVEVIEVDENPTPRSYADWAAVFAGALIAIATALVLTAVGAAIGLSVVSPWEEAPEASTVGLAAAAWLALTTLYSAAVGGYIAGRLRSPVRDATPDENELRDGLNGLLVWAIGITAAAVMAAMAATSIGSAAARVGGAAIQAAGKAAGGTTLDAGTIDYYVDRALRPAPGAAATPPAPGSTADIRREAARIVTTSLARGSVSDEDKTYLASVVASRTGLSEQEARKRIDTFVSEFQSAADQLETKARQAADTARKAAALAGTLNAVISFLAGLLATFAAQIGGRHRDDNILSTKVSAS